MSIYAQYAALLDGVLDELVSEGALPADVNRRAVAVEPPAARAPGDLATNAAMVPAKQAKPNPRGLAEAIKTKLEALPPVATVGVGAAGVRNLRLKPEA